MRLADQLASAVIEGRRLPFGAGQEVEVRTHAGALVMRGEVLGVSDETRSVMVVDRASGSDMMAELDPDMYDIRIAPREAPGDAPSPGEQPSLSILPSRPGPYTGGRW